MHGAQVVAILNELLTLEQRSLAPRLVESTVSASSASVPALLLMEETKREQRVRSVAMSFNAQLSR